MCKMVAILFRFQHVKLQKQNKAINSAHTFLGYTEYTVDTAVYHAKFAT